MKPRAFSYVKPTNLAEALGLLREHQDDAQIIAGGQSLVPTLNFRLSAPSLLVDINGLQELTGITEHADTVRIGALTRYRDIETSGIVARHVPLLHMAVPFIAHPAIRNRGTIGGSVALADPAAEMPACLVALGATMVITTQAGEQRVAAEDFFHALYDTELSESDILTAIDVPKRKTGYRSAFDELARRRGDYAMCGACAQASVNGTKVDNFKLVYFSVGDKPVVATNTMATVNGKNIDDKTIHAAQDALTGDLEPTDDLHCSAKLRMHYARLLAKHLLMQLVEAPA